MSHPNKNAQVRMVVVLVDMPFALKVKLHAEAKRRGQSLSEFIISRCDFKDVGK